MVLGSSHILYPCVRPWMVWWWKMRMNFRLLEYILKKDSNFMVQDGWTRKNRKETNIIITPVTKCCFARTMSWRFGFPLIPQSQEGYGRIAAITDGIMPEIGVRELCWQKCSWWRCFETFAWLHSLGVGSVTTGASRSVCRNGVSIVSGRLEWVMTYSHKWRSNGRPRSIPHRCTG